MQRIIYLPGWLNTAKNLEPLAGAVGGDFRLLDLPADRIMSVADYAGWVASRISEPAYIAGHSFGGKVAVAVAALYPEKVMGIFVIAGSNRGRWVFRMLRPAVKLAKLLGFSGKRFRAADYEKSSEIMKKNMSRTLDFDILPLARRVKCPAVFIYGEDDVTTPTALGKKLAAAATGRLFALGGFNHHTIITDGIWQVSAIIKKEIK